MAELTLPLLVEAAKPVVEITVRRVVEAIHFIRSFKKELDNLKGKLVQFESILLKLDGVSDPTVEQWLKNTLRIINNAEDMLDVLAYEKHRNAVMKRRPNKTAKRLVYLPLKRVYFRTKMAMWIRRVDSDMKAALAEFSNIAQLKDLEGKLMQSRTTMTNDDVLQQVRQNVDMTLFVGREYDVDSVVEMLLPNSDDNISKNRLSFVAIVGIGGMGKTTLANKVYTNKRVESHFNERMWISYLEGFNIKTVLNLMVESLRKGNYEDASRQTAIETLRGHLGGRRYLLVLDDVWNTNIDLWNSMRYALEDIGGSKDSMVLITTRDDAVVKAMDPSSVHPLSRLSEPNSWSLFEKIACVEQFNGDAFAFKDIGRRIVAKCKGVPLAIRSIAGVLYHKKNLREWMKIEESELWYVLRNETNNRTGVLAILKLSYDHLPSKLKKCFCLCALWPKGWLVEKYDLIGRWMALGLLETSIDENLTMEDVGERYLSALVSISFVIVNKRNEFGEEYLYSLHDLVYDLARTIVMHERMYLEAGKRVNKVPDIQHLTTIGYAEITSDFPDKLVLKNIRSLDMLKNLPRGILEDVKYLRVLCLAHSSLEVVLESLSRLKCLKYLQLEGNPIKMLPKCIMKLYNLQSLFLYECKSLSRLPIGLNNLVNLRHLGLSFHLCPNKGTIEQLSQLQTLPPLQLIEGGFQISELGCLPDLKGTLDIKGLELVKSKLDAKESKLSTKLRVEQLQLSWDDDGNCEKQEEVLDGLCPHENLKKITLKGYQGDEFPSWLMRMNVFQESRNGFAGTLQNLIKIELLDCKKCKRLPTLGQLRSLKVIQIRNMGSVKHIGPEFYGAPDLLLGNTHKASSNDSTTLVKPMTFFKSLKELHLGLLSGLEEWCEPGPEAWIGYPSLEVLVIDFCPFLKITPNNFPSLKELTIKDIQGSQHLSNIMANKRSIASLKKLYIEFVMELEHIPPELGECTSLQSLIIKLCPDLTCLPDSLSKLISLEELQIEQCRKLRYLFNFSGLSSLRELKFSELRSIIGLPEGLHSCKSLLTLSIDNCPEIETLPDLAGLSSLMGLDVRGMSKIISDPPPWLYSLSCLRSMDIGSYEELNEFPDISPLLKMKSLKDLYLYGWEVLQSLPEQLQHFTALETLGIGRFDDVTYLPEWLGNLSSLKILSIVQWDKLKKLPSKDAMKRLTNLRELRISSCPLLVSALEINGQEYHKIADACFEVRIED